MMRMGRTIEFNDDFQDIPVSHRGKQSTVLREDCASYFAG